MPGNSAEGNTAAAGEWCSFRDPLIKGSIIGARLSLYLRFYELEFYQWNPANMTSYLSLVSETPESTVTIWKTAHWKTVRLCLVALRKESTVIPSQLCSWGEEHAEETRRLNLMSLELYYLGSQPCQGHGTWLYAMFCILAQQPILK